MYTSKRLTNCKMANNMMGNEKMDYKMEEA